jgi:hypothetical protein
VSLIKNPFFLQEKQYFITYLLMILVPKRKSFGPDEEKREKGGECIKTTQNKRKKIKYRWRLLDVDLVEMYACGEFSWFDTKDIQRDFGTQLISAVDVGDQQLISIQIRHDLKHPLLELEIKEPISLLALEDLARKWMYILYEHENKEYTSMNIDESKFCAAKFQTFSNFLALEEVEFSEILKKKVENMNLSINGLTTGDWWRIHQELHIQFEEEMFDRFWKKNSTFEQPFLKFKNIVNVLLEFRHKVQVLTQHLKIRDGFEEETKVILLKDFVISAFRFASENRKKRVPPYIKEAWGLYCNWLNDVSKGWVDLEKEQKELDMEANGYPPPLFNDDEHNFLDSGDEIKIWQSSRKKLFSFSEGLKKEEEEERKSTRDIIEIKTSMRSQTIHYPTWKKRIQENKHLLTDEIDLVKEEEMWRIFDKLLNVRNELMDVLAVASVEERDWEEFFKFYSNQMTVYDFTNHADSNLLCKALQFKSRCELQRKKLLQCNWCIALVKK